MTVVDETTTEVAGPVPVDAMDEQLVRQLASGSLLLASMTILR